MGKELDSEKLPPVPTQTADPGSDDDIDISSLSSGETTGLSGSKSGSSVLTWDELVRQQGGDDQVELGSADERDFDPASDQDILREALSGEKPPSKVIPRTESHPELDVANPVNGSGQGLARPPAPSEDDDDAAISGSQPDAEGSSVLSSLGLATGSPSDVIAGGSRLDILGHLRPTGGSSARLSKTDDLPKVVPNLPSADDESLVDELESDEESSAVDLGSRPTVRMAFPLGDSEAVSEKQPESVTSQATSDSNAVDLFGGSAAAGRARGSAASAEAFGLQPVELPSARRARTVDRSRGAAWLGGSLVGVVVAGGLFTALYAAGIVHFSAAEAAKPLPAVAHTAATPNLPQGNELAEARKAYDDLMAKLNAAGVNPDRLGNVKKLQSEAVAAKRDARDAQTKLDKLKADLDAAQQQANRERDRAAQLTEQLQKATQSTTGSSAEMKKLQDARAAAEAALREAENRLAQLRQSQADEAALAVKKFDERFNTQAAETAAVRKQLTEFTEQLTARLAAANLVAAGAKPAELLAALDQVLRQKPAAATVADPAQADRLFGAGFRAYRERDFDEAEKLLAGAVRANRRDARIYFLLGLSRYHLGRASQAADDFYAATALERQYSPGPQEVEEMLARLPAADRALVARYRR